MTDRHSSEFLTALHSRVLIGDGAMGTQLQSFDLDVDADFLGYEGCNEILNDTRPDIIETIHRRYFEAGADLWKPIPSAATSRTSRITTLKTVSRS